MCLYCGDSWLEKPSILMLYSDVSQEGATQFYSFQVLYSETSEPYPACSAITLLPLGLTQHLLIDAHQRLL